MPTYDYHCNHCGHTCEIIHLMSDEDPQPCPECNTNMEKQIGCGYLIVKNGPPSLANEIRAREERAAELRKRPVKRSHSGTGSGHGKALGGQHIEVDKQQFIKAAAKDPLCVKLAQDALKKSNSKNGAK